MTTTLTKKSEPQPSAKGGSQVGAFFSRYSSMMPTFAALAILWPRVTRWAVAA